MSAQARAPLPGEAELRRFESLMVEDGLPHNTVYSIAQDSTGFLWLGTANGLARHDGYGFTHFRHDPNDDGSLATADISCLFADSRGTIWIGTWGGGLDRFDPLTETFTHHRSDRELPGRLRDDRVQVVFEDRRGVIWVGTFGGGLARLDAATPGGETGAFATFRHDPGDPASLSHDRVWSIADGGEGKLWVATSDGLSIFDRATETFTVLRHDPGDPASLGNSQVRALFFDRDGVLWVGTQAGLDRYDRRTGRFANVLPGPGEAPSTGRGAVNVIFEGSRGGLWIGTADGGLVLVDRAAGTARAFVHDPHESGSLPDDDVRAILEDRSQVLWIGTREGGLGKLDLKPPKFRHVTHRADDPASLRSKNVRAFAEDPLGRLWVGTSHGLDRYDDGERRFIHFPHGPGDPRRLPGADVHLLFVDRSGELWIGVGGGGLSRFLGDDEGFETLRHDPGDPASLASDLVTALAEDRSGTLWVGTDRGLSRFDRAAASFAHFRHDRDDPRSLSHDRVRVIREDLQGALWVGTDGGLNRCAADGRCERFLNDPGDPESLSHDRVYAIHDREPGRLWIGTARGLDELRGDGAFRRRHEGDGLAGTAVLGILCDARGRLWLATNGGLSRFDPATETFRNYTVRDGLQALQFVAGAALERRDGRLLFGGNNGFNVFHPDRVTDNPHVPPVVLTAFKRFGEPLAFDVSPAAVRAIELSHRDNFFSFEFAALDFTSPRDNRYRYKLEGFDRDWTAAGPHPFASYANVAAGSYVFRVQGSNNDAVWNNEGLALAVRIAPPWWRSAWARLLGVLLLLAGGGTALRLQVHRQTRRERELQQRVDAGLAELRRVEERLWRAQKLESLEVLAGGIAHDFNNLLVGILGHAELARLKLEPGSPIREFLDEIEATAHRAAALAKKMLAYSGKGRFVTTSLDLSDAVDEVVALVAVPEQVAIEPRLGHDLPAVDADAAQVHQLLTNLITNAVEAIGDAEGVVEITTGARHCDRAYLAATYIDEGLKAGLYAFVEVRDNGPGMEEEVQARIFDPFFTTRFPGRGLGLPVVLGIVRGHHGALEISSEPGRGTSVRVLLPASEAAAAEPAEVAADDEAWRGSGKVLVIDDEPVVRLIARQMLEILGFEVLVATGGEEGVELFRRHRDEIVLVVLDLTMPRMSGEEVFRALRRLRRDVRVLLASGYEEQEATERFELRDLAGFMQKPYQLATLRRKVRQALES